MRYWKRLKGRDWLASLRSTTELDNVFSHVMSDDE